MSLPHRNPTPDPESFAALFEQYKNLVYKTAYLMLNDAAEAEDALQEVFVLVYKSLSRFDPRKGAFTTWLHRITMNYCLMHRRKRRFLFYPLDGHHPAFQDKSAETLVAASDEKKAIVQAIQDLSDKQRAVVVLRYYLDLPHAEIAQVLDIPLGTVKSRLDSSIRILRQKLGGLAEDRFSNPSPEMEVGHGM